MIFTIIWLIGSIVAYIFNRKIDGPSKTYAEVVVKLIGCIICSWLIAIVFFIVSIRSKPPKWL